MESRHCGQDKRIFFCPVHNASTPCSPQAFVLGENELITEIERTNQNAGKVENLGINHIL